MVFEQRRRANGEQVPAARCDDCGARVGCAATVTWSTSTTGRNRRHTEALLACGPVCLQNLQVLAATAGEPFETQRLDDWLRALAGQVGIQLLVDQVAERLTLYLERRPGMWITHRDLHAVLPGRARVGLMASAIDMLVDTGVVEMRKRRTSKVAQKPLREYRLLPNGRPQYALAERLAASA